MDGANQLLTAPSGIVSRRAKGTVPATMIYSRVLHLGKRISRICWKAHREVVTARCSALIWSRSYNYGVSTFDNTKRANLRVA